MFENLEMSEPDGNIENWGFSMKNHVINLKTGKETKMIVFDFGAFQRKMQMSSRDKYLIDMFLGNS